MCGVWCDNCSRSQILKSSVSNEKCIEILVIVLKVVEGANAHIYPASRGFFLASLLACMKIFGKITRVLIHGFSPLMSFPVKGPLNFIF